MGVTNLKRCWWWFWMVFSGSMRRGAKMSSYKGDDESEAAEIHSSRFVLSFPDVSALILCTGGVAVAC